MPRFMPISLRRLLRDDGRRRRFVARHHWHRFGERRRFDGRRYGVGRFIGRRHGAGGYRSRRHGTGRFRGQGNRYRSGAGPANGVAPLPMPSAPLRADENADPAPAALPPAFWCSEHGWVICPLHEDGPAVGVDAVGQSPTSVFKFGSTSATVVDANAVTPRLPSPTPAVVDVDAGAPLWLWPSVAGLQDAPRVRVREGDELAFVSAPTGATSFQFGSGVRSFSSAAVVDSVAPPRLPSPTLAVDDETVPPGYAPMPLSATRDTPAHSPPAAPPSSSHAGVRRRLLAPGVPLSSPSGHGRRAGAWSPAALGLANGVSNGVAPGTWLPGGSSDEEEGGGSAARRR